MQGGAQVPIAALMELQMQSHTLSEDVEVSLKHKAAGECGVGSLIRHCPVK